MAICQTQNRGSKKRIRRTKATLGKKYQAFTSGCISSKPLFFLVICLNLDLESSTSFSPPINFHWSPATSCKPPLPPPLPLADTPPPLAYPRLGKINLFIFLYFLHCFKSMVSLCLACIFVFNLKSFLSIFMGLG